jgi:hypothetical protein
MSRSVIESLFPLVEDSINLLTKLVDLCPDNLLNAKTGGWPLWQHVIHAISTVDFFLPFGEPLSLPEPLTPAVAHLSEVGSAPPSRAAILDFIQKGKQKAAAYAASLTDSDLAQPNDKLRAFNLNWSIARSLVSIASHCQYHLGHGDALLRDKGHAGAF